MFVKVLLFNALIAVALTSRLPVNNYTPLQDNYIHSPALRPFIGGRHGGLSHELGHGGPIGGFGRELGLGNRHGGLRPEYGIGGRHGGLRPEYGLGSRHGGHSNEYGLGSSGEIPQYNFEYAVADEYTNSNFGQQETRDGYDTKGSYFVLLPDGRKQIVNYYVSGDSGYVAEVTYEGEANYVEPPYGNVIPRPISPVLNPSVINPGYQPNPYNLPIRPVPIPSYPQERYGY